MPSGAVTIAYAAAMQESHLHNLDYGDLDSVGVFQQRPSEGWGPAAQAHRPRLRDRPGSSAPWPRCPATCRCRCTRRPRPCSTARTAPPTCSTSGWRPPWPPPSPADGRTRSGAGPRLATPARHLTSRPARAAGAHVRPAQLGSAGTRPPWRPRPPAGGGRSRPAPRGGWAVATWLVTHAATYGHQQRALRRLPMAGKTAGRQGWKPGDQFGRASGSVAQAALMRNLPARTGRSGQCEEEFHT